MLNLVLTLIVVGVLLWAVNQYVPMAAPIKNILNIVVVLGVLFYVLDAFGVLEYLRNMRVPRARGH